MRTCSIRSFIILLIFPVLHHAAIYNDFLQAQFMKDWAAYCTEQSLPSYDAREIGPEIRKCDTERCVFFMYKYISDNRPEFFREFDICFETNTSKHKSGTNANSRDVHYRE